MRVKKVLGRRNDARALAEATGKGTGAYPAAVRYLRQPHLLGISSLPGAEAGRWRAWWQPVWLAQHRGSLIDVLQCLPMSSSPSARVLPASLRLDAARPRPRAMPPSIG